MLSVVLFCFLAAVISYLLGSINFAVILSNLFEKKDVRNMGSGNAGMTNVLRNFGALPGILTFFGDFLKAVAGVYIGMYVISPYILNVTGYELKGIYLGYICAAFSMVGHIFPVFFQFRGGKGIVVAIGSIFLLDWRIACALLIVFSVTVLISGIISLGSVIAAASFPLFIIVFNLIDKSDALHTVICLAIGVTMAALTILMHRENIKRLIKGEEKKLRIKGSDKR